MDGDPEILEMGGGEGKKLTISKLKGFVWNVDT